MKKSLLITLLAFLPLIAITVSSQCRYCNTYEDFLEGHWEQVDTVYFSSHKEIVITPERIKYGWVETTSR